MPRYRPQYGQRSSANIAGALSNTSTTPAVLHVVNNNKMSPAKAGDIANQKRSCIFCFIFTAIHPFCL